MFSCFNPNKTPGGKCEWREGHLQEFVRQLNQDRGTTYQLAECLDVPTPGKPMLGDKQPEVLVIGMHEQPMVIERKQVVSQSYAKHHANQHLIYDTIPELLAPHLSGALYLLEIEDSSLLEKTKLTLQTEALQIVDQVKANLRSIIDGQSIADSTPFPWRFGVVPESLRDDSAPTAGIGINIKSKSIFDQEPSDALRFIELARTEYRELVEYCLTEAEPKFRNYSNHRKVVLLEFYGDRWLLDEDDMREIVAKAQLPSLIDEVWMAVPEWVSESDYEVRYEQVR